LWAGVAVTDKFLPPGLPDGIASNQKDPNLGKFSEGPAMEDVGICHVRLVYFTAVWYILWPFNIFYGCLVCFSPFWYFVPRKIWQHCLPRNWKHSNAAASHTLTFLKLTLKKLT
jgi:hypothetical protein